LTDQDISPEIEEPPSLVFLDENGKIRIGCYFGDFDDFTFDLGIVPDEIANGGPTAIRSYADEKKDDLIARERTRQQEREDRIQNLHREYTVEHDGVIIRGFVRKDRYEGPRADFMKLVMTEPYQISTDVYVRPQCFAYGMTHTRSFDEDGNLLEQEIERQRNTLIAMYKRWQEQQNRPPPHPALAELTSKS
jgi:hypothetical protein